MVTSGTIGGDSNFDAEVDACKLRIALREAIEKDVGVENALAQLLVTRTNCQRQEIEAKYKELFNLGLCEHVEEVVQKGNFLDSVKALMLKPRVYDADCLHEAIVDGNDSTICEILTTRTCLEMEEIRAIYEKEFESTIASDLDDYLESTASQKEFYLKILDSPRSTTTNVDGEVTVSAVDTLIKAEQSLWDMTKCTDVLDILAGHNFTQIRAVLREFQRRKDGNMEMLESSLKKHCTDDVLSMCIVMWVKAIRNVTQLFSELLYLSVTSLAADSARVIRIVVGRSEIDLTQIKSHYMMQYNKQLQLAVQQKCGNDLSYSNIIALIIKN